MQQKSRTIPKRITALLLCGCALLSLFAATFAWVDFNQHTIHPFWGSVRTVGSVILTKNETGKDGSGGSDTVVLPGAEFYLYRIEEDLSETQVNGRYVTNGDGQLVAHSLPPGNYVFVETTPPFGWDFEKDRDGNPITRYPFTIGGDAGLHVEVKAANTRLLAGLTLTKTVTNECGRPLSDEQKALEFTFTVAFSDGGTYECAIDGGAAFPVASGGTLKLKHGQSAVFQDIPVGVQYTIRETPVDGYATISENSQGHIVPGGAVCSFTNTFPSGADVGSLRITKTTSGEYAQPGDAFDFLVEFSDGGTYTYTVDGGAPVSLTSGDYLALEGGQTALFENLPVGLGYAVTEGNSPPGYQGKVHKVEGQIIEAGSTAAFQNHYGDESGEDGALSITKELAGNDTDPAKDFVFTVMFNDGVAHDYTVDGGPVQTLASGGTLTLKGGETALFANLSPALGYTVEETDYSADGYRASVQRVQGKIVSGETATLLFVNEKNAPKPEDDTLLRVKKVVDGTVTDKKFSITVKIDHDANNVHDTHPVELAHGETAEFTLPYGASYEVTEQDYFADGYTQTTTLACGTVQGETEIEAVITNTWFRPVMIVIPGEKTWNTIANPSIDLPQSITVRLKNGSIVVAEKVVAPDANGKWEYQFDAPQYAPNGSEIQYTVEEDVPPGFWPEYVTENGNRNIQNHAYAPLAVDFLKVKKSIAGDDVPTGDIFAFTLTGQDDPPMPNGAVAGVKTITVTGQATGEFGRITFGRPGTYRYRVQEVDGGLAGYTYDTASYSVTITVEDAAGTLTVTGTQAEKDGQIQLPTPNQLEFTNLYAKTAKDPVDVSVRKVWQGENANQPSEVNVQLYKDGTALGDPIALNEANSWNYTWINLDPDAHWTVDEPAVPEGYRKSVSGNVQDGFVIANHFDRNTEIHIIEGAKTWNHGSNPERNHPTEITVLVKDGAYVAAQKRITAAEGWRWRFELPRYDSKGREIAYTVEEQPVPGYAATPNGYSILNTYTGGSEGKPGGGTSPQTGDNLRLWLWAGLFAASATALLALLIWRRHQRRRQKKKAIQHKLKTVWKR